MSRAKQSSINEWTYQWARQVGQPCTYLPEMTSTSDVAKNEWKGREPFHLFLADHQSAGRGRGGSRWDNLASGEILLSTWCFALQGPPQPVLPPRVGLGLYQVLQTHFPNTPFALKAPNDILIEGQKLSGLLLEVSQQGDQIQLLVGLGLNVWGAPQVDQKTTCLAAWSEVSQVTWFAFCEGFFTSLKLLAQTADHKSLGLQEQQDLLIALNQGRSGHDLYTRVHPNGDLDLQGQRLSWTQL